MATRADVARLAGVSPSTVTYALSGDRPIAEGTRSRILAAAKELGYRPNVYAQGLAGGRSRVIALVFPSHERGVNDSDVEYLLGATEAARALDHQVLLWTPEDIDLTELTDVTRNQLIDGLLLMEVRLEDARVEFLRRSGTPFALIGRTADPTGMLYSDRDFAAASRMAVEHLVGLGHRRIALIDSPERLHELGLGAVVRAQAGVIDAAAALGIQVDVHHCDPTVESGRAVFIRLLGAEPAVTAAIGLNDEATLGVYQGAQSHGMRVPENLSVVSLSVSAKRASFFYPPITAISPPAVEIGASAARALIHQLTGRRAPSLQQTLWAGRLVERGSTAPAHYSATRL
jgi:DNA-binding LacI/PurR family transcriptional regulator